LDFPTFGGRGLSVQDPRRFLIKTIGQRELTPQAAEKIDDREWRIDDHKPLYLLPPTSDF
jgi:hypothetical protein